MACIFCKISAGEIPSDTVYEDSEIRVFKDIHPKAPVHLLVVPKKHVESVASLEESDRESVAKLIYAAKKAAEDQGLKGYKLTFNVGREGGQEINHLHLHLLGGWKREGRRNSKN